ncbi:hypothetical protein ACFUIT_03695 [Streptomyces sp. NPDC057239]|uniref:hypothetical protein n=1 Tax=Streptomyces sp. NPDC057239 TaxID=3346061 RepID=UPI0036399322
MNATAPPKPGVKMTIRVYTVNAQGAVIEDRGELVAVGFGEDPAVLAPDVYGFPPCRCPRHRARLAVAR